MKTPASYGNKLPAAGEPLLKRPNWSDADGGFPIRMQHAFGGKTLAESAGVAKPDGTQAKRLPREKYSWE